VLIAYSSRRRAKVPCPDCGAEFADGNSSAAEKIKLCSQCWQRRDLAWKRYEEALAHYKARGSPKPLIPWGWVWWLLFLGAAVASMGILAPVIAVLWFLFGRDSRPRPPKFGPVVDDLTVFDYEPRP
jgi:hypothetical protein